MKPHKKTQESALIYYHTVLQTRTPYFLFSTTLLVTTVNRIRLHSLIMYRSTVTLFKHGINIDVPGVNLFQSIKSGVFSSRNIDRSIRFS